MILIYSQKITERLTYIVQHIFGERLQWEFQITSDYQGFIDFRGKKLSYGIPFENCPYIESKNLLFETDIHYQNIDYDYIDSTPICFLSSENDLLGFDIFTACFYFLTRYEEYLPTEKDALNRFLPHNAWNVQHHCVDKAIVDRWILLFKEKMLSFYPSLPIVKHQFSFLPTYDIDIAFCYQNKGLFLTFVGIIKHLLTSKFHLIYERLLVLFRKKNDPYNSFDYIISLHKKYNLKSIFFFLVANNRNKYDKNISIKNIEFQNIITNLHQQNTIGLHASFSSNNNLSILKKEIDFLQNLIQQPITANRQHYLILSFPNTYRSLIKYDITDDYTMGYVSQSGFRAGTCNSFYFFDLQNNKATSLKIHPLILMENGLREIKDTNKIIKYVELLIDEIYNLNGECITLFHNSSFNEYADNNWKQIYEHILDYINNKINSLK